MSTYLWENNCIKEMEVEQDLGNKGCPSYGIIHGYESECKRHLDTNYYAIGIIKCAIVKFNKN